MNILRDVSLKLYSTMRLGGTAEYVATVTSTDELIQAEAWAEAHGLPVLVIGEGSNIIWRDDGYHGLVIVNRIKGFTQVSDDAQSVTYRVGAGENWDKTVDRLVAKSLSGVEAMSLIPGTAGATPVQNVGAYGQEIAQVLVAVEAYDVMTKQLVTLAAADCAFGYRTSRFKTTDKGRFMITAITLKLHRDFSSPPRYQDFSAYFQKHGITEFSPAVVREATIAIRRAKLPDPAKTPNCGSFFGNPIVTKKDFSKIARKHPTIKTTPHGWSQPPHWDLHDGTVKLSAGWLVQEAGFANKRDRQSGMRTWPKQNLVLVNERAVRTQDLLDFRQQILDAVQAKFGVLLEQEPEMLP